MPTPLFAFAVAAGLDWLAVARHLRPLEYLAKPAVLAILALWALQAGASGWVVAALLFSLAGDVFLMLPGNLFLAGLGSFLIAHLAFLAGFDAPWSARLPWLAGVLVLATPIALPLMRAVTGPLRAAVGVYMVALAAMVASALATGDPTASAGGLLFLASDSMLGWNRFVRPWSWAKLAVHVTYHLGQLLLTRALAGV